MARHQLLSLNLVVLALMMGCSSEAPTQIPDSTELPSIDATDDAGAAVSDEEAREFALGWEAAVKNGDVAKGQQLILFDEIINRGVAPFKLGEKELQGFRRGIKQSQPFANILRQLNQAENGGGSYRLVRTAVRGGEQHAIFRLVGIDQSLNYHDLRLVKRGDSVKADQFFVAATGEEFADTITGLLAPSIASQKSLIGRFDGSAKQSLQDLSLQKEMMTAARMGNHQKALETYEKISDEGKATKIVQLGRIMASANGDEEEYLKILDEYATRFPNDPSLALVSIDAGFLRKDADQLLNAFQGLQAWTGGDDYLALLVGSVLAQMGNPEKASEIYGDVDSSAFSSAEMHDFALGLCLSTKNHVGALRHLRALRDEYDFQFDDLRTAEGFGDFVQSEEFEQWEND